MRKYIKRTLKITGIIIGAFFLLVVVVGLFSDGQESSTTTNNEVEETQADSNPTSNENTQQESDTLKDEEKPQEVSASTVDRVKEIVGTVGNYEVTLWDKNNNLATAQTPSPYEVIVNTAIQNDYDCFDAKNSLFSIMKGIYGDAEVRNEISRVKFSVPGQLRASLGYNDAKNLSWGESGPSNYWSVTLQYKSYEDERGDLASRTWGVAINPSCK